MKVTFLGVGEAVDERLSNNSHLVQSAKTTMLVDCGYAIPHQLWKYNDDRELLDAIYLSHPHADHYFGIPALLWRMSDDQRKKPLTVICQQGMKEQILAVMEIGYKGIFATMPFATHIHIIEVNPGQTIKFQDLTLTFAPTIHSVQNFAVRISDGKKTLCSSGDGMFTPATEKLYAGCDLLIHEAYLYDEAKIGHAYMTGLIAMTKKQKVKKLAFVHINRNLRRNGLETLKKTFPSFVVVPECGQEMRV